MIKLKDILKEDDFDVKFGQVPFGEWDEIRQLLKSNPEYEADTEFEKEFLKLLKKWSSPVSSGSNFSTTSRELYDKFQIIKKASLKYPEIFKPDTPNGTELYRGLNVLSPKLLSQISNVNKSDFIEIRIDGIPYRKLKKSINYTPRNPVQSWTSSEEIARKFFARSTGVLLVTTQTENFYFSQQLMQILWGLRPEYETMHFGTDYSKPVLLIINEEKINNYIVNG